MKVTACDPRTTTTLFTAPRYRVDFWTRSTDEGWSSREFRIEGEDIDVHDVLIWVESQRDSADERTVLYAEVTMGEDVTLIRLSGDAPA